jgi:ATP-binding cassette subfamily B protein
MNRIRLKRLWEFTAGFRGRYFATLGCVVMDVVLNFLWPLILGWMIDGVFNGNPLTGLPFLVAPAERGIEAMGGMDVLRANLWVVAVLVIGIWAVRGVFMFLRGRLGSTTAEGVARGVRNRLYRHLQSLPYDYHVKAATGDLIQRCTTDVDTTRMFVGTQSPELLRAVVVLVTTLTVLLWLNATLTLLSMCLVPVLMVFAFLYFKKIQKQINDLEMSDGAMSTCLQENLTGVRVVRAFGREQHEKEKFAGKVGTLKDKVIALTRMFATFWSFSDFITIIQQVMVLYFGAWFAVQGKISLGTFVIFNSYVGMFLWPFRNFGRQLADFGRMLIAVGRLNDILIEKPEDSGPDAVKPPLDRDIAFDGVTFGYDGGEPVLKDLSFTVKAGETVAILGATGSGKSSLVHLLQRLYDYQGGSVRIGGVELNTIEKHWLRSHVGIVLQEPFLYGKTVRENIGIVHRDPDPGEVEEVARVAAIHDVVKTFDLGYETIVGERGVTLSGGQKQRVAIARTLMKDNDILVFDDSLSAVDTETDAAIREALKERRKGVTTFIISHRISTLSEADRILVLEGGRVAQNGTHEELVKQDGLYRRIWAIQNALEEELEEEEDGFARFSAGKELV